MGSSRILSVLGWLRWDWLNVRLAGAAIEIETPHPGEPVVLFVSRGHNTRDLAELRKRTRLNWCRLEIAWFGHLIHHLLPYEMRRQTYHVRFQGPRYDAARRRLEAFTTAVLGRAFRTVPLDAVLSANIDYAQDIGLQVYCRKHAIPFLALVREHAVMEWEHERLRLQFTQAGFRFEGDGVAVWGGTNVGPLVDTGACRADQVWVVGPPRQDGWWDVAPARQDTIVLLSFAHPGYHAQDTFRETLAAFVNVARRHAAGDVRFVIKAREANDAAAVRALLARLPPSGITVVDDEPLYRLYPRTRLVIGFNSLAVAEALRTHAEVVVPWWADTVKHPLQLLYDPRRPLAAAVIDFPASPEALGEVVDRAAGPSWQPAPARQERADLLHHFFGARNGRPACEETERFVRHFLAMNAQRRGQ